MVKDNNKNSGLLGRYVWLVEVIGRNSKITFDEINKIWLESPLNPMKAPLPKKTFQNHCAKIKEIFGVDILCDRIWTILRISRGETSAVGCSVPFQ